MQKSLRSVRLCAGLPPAVSGWQFPFDRFPFDSTPVICEQPTLGVQILYGVWRDEKGKDLYDQPFIVERGGSISFLVADGKVGLVKCQRPFVRNIERFIRDYPTVDPENIGSIMWEAPRGLRKEGEDFHKAAEREAEEESGGRMVRLSLLPIWATSNPTYFVNPTACYLIEVDLSVPGRPADPLEGIIGKAEFFSLAEYATLLERGDSVDPATGYIMNYLQIRRPGLLR